MEDVNRSPLVTIESIRSHPCHSTLMFTTLSKLPHVTGTSHRIKAILVHLCSGLWLPIRELRTTLRSVALPFSSSGDRPRRWDFNPADTKCYCSRINILFKCPVVILSFYRFKARSHYLGLRTGRCGASQR